AESTLCTDEVGHDIDMLGLPDAWEPTFVTGVRGGVTAAASLLRSVGEATADSGHRRYRVAGLISRPHLEGESAGLAVALNRLRATVTALDRTPPVVATGVLTPSRGGWRLKEMADDI